MTSIDICICTFRRPHLAKTLASIAKIILRPDWQVRVIVADNDDIPSAEKLVASAQSNFPFPIQYVRAPLRNISIARNACLDTATADYVAFVDDDELVTSEWLTALIDQQKISRADVVLGPVQAIYPPNSPKWVTQNDFHSIKPVWVKGRIITGYTSNALFVRAAPALQGQRFDLKFGKSGGEDTVFFNAVHQSGGYIEFTPHAIVTEAVAPERLRFSWLMKRVFRSGQTHGQLLLGAHSLSKPLRYLQIAGAVTKALVCYAAALGSLLVGGRFRYWLLRGTLHVGVVARLHGVAELVQYG